jgi:hypothetical protein
MHIMKKIIAMSLAAATMTFASTGAQALTLTLSTGPTLWNVGNPTAIITDNGTPISGGATIPLSPQQLTGTLGLDPVALFAYCIELYQGAGQDTFEVVSLQDYLTDVRPLDAAALYTQYASLISGHSAPVNAQVDAAVQAAVWELRYELTGNPLDAFAGSTNLTSVAGNTPAFDPNSFLNTPNAINPALQLWVAKSPNTQDFLFWTMAPIPEPTTWAMMIVGLAAVGYSMRSSRRNAAVNFA